MNGFTLAEVFSPHSANQCRAAFTLAEVLITLGIIGVVAAMTMPTLIQQHRKQVVETRLKHFYSMMNQAVTLAEVTHGDKKDWPMEENQFWKNIKPHLNYIKAEENSSTGITLVSVILPNGSAFNTQGREISFFPNSKDMISNGNYIIGKNAFRFVFYPSAPETSPYKYHQNKGVEPYLAHWDGNVDTLKTNTGYGCNSTSISSTTGAIWCGAVIQRNGWKIPKDYPFKF